MYRPYCTPEMLKGKRVFVPLCGKSNDMMWFREHADHVVGVELVEKPVLQFFEEKNLPYAVTKDGFYEAEKLTIINKNLFELTAEDIGPVDIIYDRASLIALPESMRPMYLNKLNALSHVGTQTLLVTFEYAPMMSKAPFSINPNDVEAYFSGQHTIQPLVSTPRPEMKALFNLEYVIEHAFLLTKQA